MARSRRYRQSAATWWSSCVSRSAKRHEVIDQLVELLIVELHGRHEHAVLEIIGVLDPGAQALAGVRRDPGSERCASHEVGEVRPIAPVGDRAGHGVTADAGNAQEG